MLYAKQWHAHCSHRRLTHMHPVVVAPGRGAGLYVQQSRRRIQTSALFFAHFFRRAALHSSLSAWAAATRSRRHRNAVMLVCAGQNSTINPH